MTGPWGYSEADDDNKGRTKPTQGAIRGIAIPMRTMTTLKPPKPDVWVSVLRSPMGTMTTLDTDIIKGTETARCDPRWGR